MECPKRAQHHQPRQSWTRSTNSVPAWEKRFCLEVGGMQWKYFLKAKRYTSLFTNVMEWEDSAGKESFQQAKSRFWAKNGGLPCKFLPLPNPDMYIDKIDWNAKLDPQLLAELEAARRQVEEYKEENAPVLLSEIRATGWDEDCEEWHKPLVITGMIVGDKESSGDDKKN